MKIHLSGLIRFMNSDQQKAVRLLCTGSIVTLKNLHLSCPKAWQAMQHISTVFVWLYATT